MIVWGISSCNSTNVNKDRNSEKTKHSDPTNYSDTTEIIIYATGNTMYNMAFEPDVIYENYIPDHPAVIAASDLVQPLDSIQLNFSAPPVGTYPFICSYPGHYLQMRGRLVVEP